MKISKTNHTILYTHNSLSLNNKTNLKLNNILGNQTYTQYNCNIIWVPDNIDKSSRSLGLTPQYKFGYGNSSSAWFDAAQSYVWNFNSNSNASHQLLLNPLNNFTNYTDNIGLNLIFSIDNSTDIKIHSFFSNYSTILSQNEISLNYNIALRFKLEILQYSTTVEDTVFTYFVDYNCGRSAAKNVGNPPLLPWDRDVNGNPLPPFAKDPDVVDTLDIQDTDGASDSSSSPSPSEGGGLSFDFRKF